MIEYIIPQHYFSHSKLKSCQKTEQSFSYAITKWGKYTLHDKGKIIKIHENKIHSKVYEGHNALRVYENKLKRSYEFVSWLPPDYNILSGTRIEYMLTKENPILLCCYQYHDDNICDKWIFEGKNACISKLSNYLELIIPK